MTDKSRELMGAWIDYCTSYWLIAYGNLTLEGNEPEEWIDWQIDKQRYPWYIEDVERIRRKYEHINKNGKRS